MNTSHVGIVTVFVLEHFETKFADNFLSIHVLVSIVSHGMLLMNQLLKAFQTLPMSSFSAYNAFLLMGRFIKT